MTTANEIAKKYSHLNGVSSTDLELDILRYLEHHYKSWVDNSKSISTEFKEGDIGTYRKGKWHLFHDATPYLNDENLKRKEMYESGTRHYMSSGMRMTLRPDGSEYIDKSDMPA